MQWKQCILLLRGADEVRRIAHEYSSVSNFLYLGRGFNFPAALEGALKLKEISYIHAEGYPAAEMKHGPIALIDDNMPVIFIAPKDEIYEKVLTNIQEVRARSGKVIAIADEEDEYIASIANHVIRTRVQRQCNRRATARELTLELVLTLAMFEGCE